MRLALADPGRAGVASEVSALALIGRWTSQANAVSLDAALARVPTCAAMALLLQLSLLAAAASAFIRFGASRRDIC